MEATIHSSAELQALKTWRARRGISRVALDLGRNDAVVREAERVINRNLRSCGCDVGALFVAAGLLITILRFAIANTRPTIGGTIALVFTLALIGKVIGIAIAELRVRAAIRRLR